MTIGDQSYSGATFIASTVTDATNAEQLVITLADDVGTDGCRDQKVRMYLIAAVIWMMLRAIR